MASILDTLTSQLGGDTLKQLSGMLGADEKTTGAATGAALSTLLGALSRNASTPQGAEALSSALSRDHDGSVLDNLGGLMSNPEAANGDGILGHVLGNRRGRVENALSQTTGLDQNSAGKLLATLAPMVLGALGRAKSSGNLDSNGLSGLLTNERQTMEQRQPQAAGLLGQLLDTDGDGDLDMSDIAKHGAGLLGKLFNK